jgi:hypothetical protein
MIRGSKLSTTILAKIRKISYFGTNLLLLHIENLATFGKTSGSLYRYAILSEQKSGCNFLNLNITDITSPVNPRIVSIF